MMTQMRSVLKEHMATIHGAIRRLIEDISEQESLMTYNHNPNHVKWLTGHLVFTAMLAGKTLGAQINLPDGWNELFRRGTEVNPDPAAFPSMDNIRERLFDYYRMVEEFVDLSTDAALASEVEVAQGWTDTRIGAVLFLLSHDFYHAGQIAMIRRELGRERSFG